MLVQGSAVAPSHGSGSPPLTLALRISVQQPWCLLFTLGLCLGPHEGGAMASEEAGTGDTQGWQWEAKGSVLVTGGSTTGRASQQERKALFLSQITGRKLP